MQKKTRRLSGADHFYEIVFPFLTSQHGLKGIMWRRHPLQYWEAPIDSTNTHEWRRRDLATKSLATISSPCLIQTHILTVGSCAIGRIVVCHSITGNRIRFGRHRHHFLTERDFPQHLQELRLVHTSIKPSAHVHQWLPVGRLQHLYRRCKQKSCTVIYGL